MTIGVDPEVEFYQKQVRDFMQQQFEKLHYRERLLIGAQAVEIVNELRERNQYCKINTEDVLILAIYACYYLRFRESPVETAILHQ